MQIEMNKLSPMMRRYFEIKENYPDCLIVGPCNTGLTEEADDSSPMAKMGSGMGNMMKMMMNIITILMKRKKNLKKKRKKRKRLKKKASIQMN